MPPRKSWKPKGSRGQAQRPHGKSAAAADPNPAHEYPYDASAAAAAEALERLDVSAAAEEDPPVETPPPPPPPQPEAPAPAPPSQPPVEASSSGSGSGSAAAGGGRAEGALRRLRELVGIGREEVELTEEEVRANDQRQEDEICALEAIFGDTVVMLNREEGQRSFQVHVHIEIPDGTDVSARLSFGAGTLNYKGAHDEGASDDLVYKFRVEHLPPILLTCLLPSSYPSHQPPFFTLSTEWLDKVMLSSLCHMLDMIWEEQLGMEVVYQWVQWLQSSSLSYLGFDNEIVLSKGDLTCVEDGGDNRACPDDAPPDLTIPRIIRYNDDKRHEAFLHGIHDCMICFSELPGVDFIKLPCHHFFCQKCMQTYCKMHVKEGTVVKLLCPDTKCEGVVPPNILKRLLGEDEFERWEGLLLQRTLDAMADVVYCPRCQTACLEDAGDEAVCSSCLFSFCTLCRERRHVGVECLSPEEKLIILERRQKSGQVKGDIQKVMDEVRSIKEILKDAKQCPRCKMAISKIEGCNKMTIDCPMKPCFLCKMPGHTTLTCPHRVAMEHGVIPAPRRNTNTSLDYVFQSQVKGKISMVKPRFLVPNQLECGNIKFHQRRVTCLEFHPTKNNVLLSGDKKGLLGIWDYVKLHEKITYDSVHSCILNSMKFDTANDGVLYTASSDGTISSTDLDTGIGSPLLNLNPDGWSGPSTWRMIYGMDLNTEKGLLLVADSFGFLYLLDRRSKERIGQPILIHKKGSKVTGLHCNPAQPEVLLSSGNDHFARIWDTRKLDPKSALASLAHGRVVNSGYFSPRSGNKIMTTCQDNRIRVWDYIFGNLESPSREIVHSHDFNRHLTPFKAEWDPKDYSETVAVIGRYISENYNGVALHPIDFIDTSTGKLLAEVMDPDITTISPVNKLHPQDDILATGSSRSIFIWKPKNEVDPTEERTSQKVKEYVYGSGSHKKPNGKHDNSSDDDSDGGGGKGKKAKKTRFTHTAKGKGKSKA